MKAATLIAIWGGIFMDFRRAGCVEFRLFFVECLDRLKVGFRHFLAEKHIKGAALLYYQQKRLQLPYLCEPKNAEGTKEM